MTNMMNKIKILSKDWKKKSTLSRKAQQKENM